MGETRSAKRTSVGKPEERRQFGRPGSRPVCEYNNRKQL
jgi:hypothetical protein